MPCFSGFMNPFSFWTELAFKLWGFGKPAAPSGAGEQKVAVAVIPTRDAQQSPPPATKDAPAQSSPKRSKGKTRSKRKARRARR